QPSLRAVRGAADRRVEEPPGRSGCRGHEPQLRAPVPGGTADLGDAASAGYKSETALMSRLRKILYLTLAVATFSASAGSFEDFFIAIRNDNTSTLGDLLRRGFDPNTADERGQPGLTMAMQEHSLRAAKLLL